MGIHRLAAIVCCCALISSPTLAQEFFNTPDGRPGVWDINVAAGAAARPTFPGSDRYRVTPVPIVIVRWRDMISLDDNGLSFYWHRDNLRIGTGVVYDGGRLDHATNGILGSGDNRLMGLGDVDAAVGARGFISYKVGPVDFGASAIKYFGRQNKGILANFGASAPLTLTTRLMLRPYIRATWADANYMQTYFGVTAIQASRSIFPEFSAGAGVEDINGGVTIVYLLSSHWFAGVDASMTQYLRDAARSPITVSNTNATIAAAVGYHF